jgi:hypothetical protein
VPITESSRLSNATFVTPPPSRKPVSKVFLSVDLTGSTAFKQRPFDPKSPWQKVFLHFYREFPQVLYQQQQDDPASGSFHHWVLIGAVCAFQWPFLWVVGVLPTLLFVLVSGWVRSGGCRRGRLIVAGWESCR